MSTKANPGAAGWAIRDRVTQLRVWGSDRVAALDDRGPVVIGSAADCDLRFEDARVSRRHARLERKDDEWIITDLGSTNGLRQDGEDRRTFTLAPAMELDLGGFKLQAESARSNELRAYHQRLLGWSAHEDVDRAVRAVRDMANLRSVLSLRGPGSMVSVARRLHALTLDAERAFHAHEVGELGVAALERARDGTLFIDAEKLPRDIYQVVAGLRLPESAVRLIVGAKSVEAVATMATLVPRLSTIAVAPLGQRSDELERILEECAADAARALGAPGPALRPHDLHWVVRSGVKTLEEADEVMLRVVAARNFGVSAGAERLGITHGALSRYLGRRKIPT